MADAETMKGDAARLDRLESRIAIADLVHGYARNVRNGRGAECAPLFTEDGVFEVRYGTAARSAVRSRLVGREAITGYITGSSSGMRPLIHNLMIEIDGDTATSNCMMTGSVAGTSYSVIGEYHDSYRRDGQWRFTSRQFTVFGDLPPEASAAEDGARELAAGDAQG